MQALDAEKMEFSSKIDLKDVSWWMSVKDAYRLGVPLIARVSKEKCIPLVARKGPFRIAHKHD
jgi:hypothetical protein